jgi:hypothetical protein
MHADQRISSLNRPGFSGRNRGGSAWMLVEFLVEFVGFWFFLWPLDVVANCRHPSLAWIE